MKKFVLIVITCLVSCYLFAQNPPPAEMADTMRGNGKIYVVVAVLLTVLAGLILYLVRLDRKISRLEHHHT